MRSTNKSELADVRRLAREKFGYDALTPAQEEVIRLVLAKQDTLSVMPTGSGKSAIYQLAGLKIGGPTVVVSPLIALQKDQLEYIREQDLAEAAVVNSTLRVAERQDAFEKLADGSLEYLFLAPEQFSNPDTMAKLKANPPSLFVVDEAHCICEWGHDFRPEYSRLGDVIKTLGRPTTLALTATASPRVREVIVERLGMRNPKVVVWGFDRPNIWIGVERCPDVETKHRLLLDKVRDLSKPGIVYVATQAAAETLAIDLRKQNVAAVHYHGGMKTSERHAAQDAFMSGEADVVVATNAFGMGVDKSDVRFVIHFDVPESIDGYFQEVGRAGRDGRPARAVLLYRPEDIGKRRAMAAGGKLTEAQVAEVIDLVQESGDAVAIKDLKGQTDVPAGKVGAALNRLSEAGVVELLPGGDVKRAGRIADGAALAEEVVAEQEKFREYRLARVDLIKDFAETIDCRRRYLLNYFGDEPAAPCGHCDNCEAGVVERFDAQSSKLPFALKSRVEHSKWGEGTVMRYEEEGAKIIVLFESQGTKSMVTSFVMEKRLLTAVLH